MNTKILIYFIFLLLSLGQLGRISFLNQQINFYLYELGLILLLLVLVFQYRFKPVIYFYQKFKFFYWFIIYAFFSYFIFWFRFTPQENLIGQLYQLRFIFYLIYLIYLSYHLQQKKKMSAIVSKSIKIFIFLTLIMTIAQYFFYPDLRNLIYQGWDPHYFRAFGVFFDTSFAAAIFGIILFYLYLTKKNRLLFSAYFILLLLTFSRGIIIAFLLTFILLLFKLQKIRQIFLLLIFFTLIIFLIPKPAGEGVNLIRTFSIRSRLIDYQVGYQIWKKQPLFGLGYNRLRYIKNDQFSHSGASLHSSFMIIIATTGIIGLALFGLGLFYLAKSVELISYLIIFLSIASLADNIFLHPFLIFLLFSLTAVNLSHRPQ